MLYVWRNAKTVVDFEPLNPGQTITANLYLQQLSRVDQALRDKGLDTAVTKCLNDNS